MLFMTLNKKDCKPNRLHWHKVANPKRLLFGNTVYFIIQPNMLAG